MSRTPAPDHNVDATVWLLVRELFNEDPICTEQMAYGHGSVTYGISLSASRIIVRTNADPNAFGGTVTNIETLGALGLPVPTVLAADLSKQLYPFAYIVTDRFEGRDLGFELPLMSHEQQSLLATQVVGFERLVMALPAGQGFGYVPIGLAGPQSSWFDVVAREQHKHTKLADDPTVSRMQERALERLQDSRERLAEIKPTCFLDDLTTKNIIVSDGRLQGVVDFDVVCYGDPLFWLALTNVAVASDVGPVGQHYVNELLCLWELSETDKVNYGLYTALHAASFLSWRTDDKAATKLLISAVEDGLAATLI